MTDRTYEILSKLDAQGFFDRMYARLTDGKGRALSESESCVYRTDKGLACPVGECIPDNHPCLNHLGGITSLLMRGDVLFDEMPWLYEHETLLRDFQHVHDEYTNWSGNVFKGVQEIRAIAQKHNLVFEPEEE